MFFSFGAPQHLLVWQGCEQEGGKAPGVQGNSFSCLQACVEMTKRNTEAASLRLMVTDSPHGEVTCGQKQTWRHPGVPDCHRGTGCPVLKDVGVPRQGRPRGSATEKDFRISSLPSPLWLGLFQRSCLPSLPLKPSPRQARAFSHPLGSVFEVPGRFP